MHLLLHYQDPTGTPRQNWIRVNQMATFGSSNQADYVVDFDPYLEPVHFTISSDGLDWTVESNTRNAISVNQQLVYSCELKDGDLIIAGKTPFYVQLGTKSPSLLVEPESTPEELLEDDLIQYQVRSFSSGVTEFHFPEGLSRVADVMAGLQKHSQTYLIANQVRLPSWSYPNWQPEIEDLFANAPESIRATDSLAIGKIAISIEDQESLADSLATGLAMCLTSKLSTEEFLEKQKIGWAWYSQSSIFRHQIEHGSSYLADMLLAGTWAVVQSKMNSKALFIYCKRVDQASIQDILDDLGFRAAT